LGQLKALILENWNKIERAPEFSIGFANLFWCKVECRDKNLFDRHMRKVKEVRNRIAHSVALLAERDVQVLFSCAQKWLTALDVGVIPRIVRYRKARPDFLMEISAIGEGRSQFEL
jgi:hypothetical protein